MPVVLRGSLLPMSIRACHCAASHPLGVYNRLRFIYIFQAVDSVPVGLYHYHPVDHVLEFLKLGNHGPTLRTVTFDQPYMETSAVVFLITGYYERLRWKYGERSYRFLCLDIGFLGENIYLTAEALGLGACAHSGFEQDAIEELLDIDGKDEIALLLLTVGALSG